jgi:uncharacterized protein YndB with AHSA1/START domain
MITVAAIVNAPMEKVWTCWISPEHITKWCHASEDWQAPRADNDARVGGRFTIRMEAKDGSAGFDFSGVYTRIEKGRILEYTMDGDGRKVTVEFWDFPNGVRVSEAFEMENENPREMQRAGWQAILNSFKKHAESD